ncbi:hypothetical protein [Streptomyces sp. NPDC049915]|uniref:hypothetical protein n=1 Tax=Streptomyces sp. NPDC049915 TaxID=3155510 RepID=UPI003425D11C
MTKPRLSEEEHAEIGKQLARMQRELARVGTKLANSYPRSGPEAQPMRRITATEEALREARYALENALFRDHPNAGVEVYFPQD